MDQIKIDRSFIIGLADGEDDTLVRCMIDLAHNLGMTAVAEGVETEAVLDQLRDSIATPRRVLHRQARPAGRIAAWLKRRRRRIEELCTRGDLP